MDLEKPYSAYYIEGEQIRSGIVVRETAPADPTGQTLYEFGHGLSTTIIYKSKMEAEASLEDGKNEKVSLGSDSQTNEP